MRLKKRFLGLMIGLSAVVLSACGQKAPNLTFEETLDAYGKQKQSLLSVLELLTATDGIVSKKVNGTLGIDLGAQESGKVVLSSTTISEGTTFNQESDLNLKLDLHSQEALMGTAVNLSAQLGLKALVKDFVPYFKLTTLDVAIQEKVLQSQVGFLTDMVGGFKDKWLTISGADFKELLSQVNSQSLLFTGEIMQDKVEYYTGVQSVQYEGQPAWKVDFNMDLIKEDAKKLLKETLMSGNNLSGEALTGDALLMLQMQQENLAQMEGVIDSMSIENVEAYFVIYAQDNVKFVIKNADVILQDQARVNIKQSVKKNQYEGSLTVQQLLTGESLGNKDALEDVVVNYLLKGSSKSKFAVDITVLQGEKQLVKLSGNLAFVLGKDALSIKPDLNLLFDEVKLSLQGEYAVEKLDNHTFTTPTDVEDLGALFGGLFGLGMSDDVAQYEQDFAELDTVATGSLVSLKMQGAQ